ncbi:hypothetical protein [Legionella sainthelensi]|uniref:Uncharacterized protein n=1 Tax=Legionella sainthelensi TaxID=28087 RepID=A0A2H5FGW5_9GAMM|nr:hypothetical protein [Legionella sainthelensi]AUH70776.1 hypothetical protein CAB17_00950 [Legionella sainthelensi]
MTLKPLTLGRSVQDAPRKEGAIITLTPKAKIFSHLKEISGDLLDLPENKINLFLDEHLLQSHTVPVCIPLMNTPHDLLSFIKSNSQILFDFMLTAWPFPIAKWGFSKKNIELVGEFIDINYFPMMCKAITKPYKNTMELAVTLATPTNTLVEYIVESISSGKFILSPDERTQLEFLLATGIAVVTNNIERAENQDTRDLFLAMNDSKNYLSPLKDKIVETLFSFYFRSKDEFPPDQSNEFLNAWFNTKTYLGLYMLTEPEVERKYA